MDPKLHIYNTLTRRKEPFEPLKPDRIGMYVCGMTVYDYCHLGHARMLLVFDMVARYLRYRYPKHKLTYVRNITDIDDKIIARANEQGESVEALTSYYIDAMHDDCKKLRIELPDEEPRATEYVEEMKKMIKQLRASDHAYVREEGGDVYFNVASFPDYGKLSGNRVEALQAGSRVAVDEAKEAAVDFVLWKAAKPGEPSWDSPWGPGRPGWHIECSAMSIKHLGEHFDIHGGGHDLIFPHHECEIAQSEAYTQAKTGANIKQRFVNVWMHNGFVRIDGDKMSKSLGNFFTIRDILKHHSGEELRYYLLMSHYRSPLNHTAKRLEQAKQALHRLYGALRGLPTRLATIRGGNLGATPPSWEINDFRERFEAAMDDDFNTPEAIAVLHDLAHEIWRRRELRKNSDDAAEEAAIWIRELGAVLGLLQEDPDKVFKRGSAADGDSPELDTMTIDIMVTNRTIARADRNFVAADQIRDELEARGIVLEDKPDGTTLWRRAT